MSERVKLYSDLIRKLRQREAAVRETENEILQFLCELHEVTEAEPEGPTTKAEFVAEVSGRDLVASVLKDLPKPFYYGDVMRMLQTLHSNLYGLKTRVYNGVAQLLREELIKRTPGGFEVVASRAGAVMTDDKPTMA